MGAGVKQSVHVQLLASLLITSVALPSTSAGAAPTVTASSLMTIAFRNADNARWVHERESLTDKRRVVESLIDVIGTSEGEQVTSFANGGRDTLIAFDSRNRLYEKANAQGLVDFQITTNTARYANVWMEETPTNPGYAYNSLGTTLRSDFGQFILRGNLTLGPVVTKNGRSVRAITGELPDSIASTPGSATMWVTTSSPILPFALQLTG